MTAVYQNAGCLLLLLTAAGCGCSGGSGSDDRDAGDGAVWRDVAVEAAVPDASPEASIPDAAVYPDCDISTLPSQEIIPGELYRLPPNGGNYMSVSFNVSRYVAYSEFRCPVETYRGYDVYVFDLETMQESMVVQRLGNQRNPSLWGNSLVYADTSFGFFEGTNRIELFRFDIPTQQDVQVTDRETAKTYPVYNGTHVAYEFWVGNSPDFVLREMSTGQEVVLADRDQQTQRCYDISEQYVTWQAIPPAEPPGTWDIFYHHIPTGQTHRLYRPTNYLLCSAVSDQWLVWNEAPGDNWEIFAYNLQTQLVEQVTNEPHDQAIHGLKGHLLIWEDYRHSGCSLFCLQKDLYLHDIETGVSRRLTSESLRWGALKPTCQWLVYTEVLADYRYRLYAWDLVAAGVLDNNCHVIPCDPQNEQCATIQWRGP